MIVGDRCFLVQQEITLKLSSLPRIYLAEIDLSYFRVYADLALVAGSARASTACRAASSVAPAPAGGIGPGGAGRRAQSAAAGRAAQMRPSR